MRKLSNFMNATNALFALLGCFTCTNDASADQAVQPPAPVITFHTNSKGIRGVQLKLYLRASSDQAWDVVTDNNKVAQLFPAVIAIKNSPRGPNFREYHLSSIIGDKLVVCRIERDNRQRRIRWQRVDGDLVDLMGWYQISNDERYPGYTRIDYVSFIDPGFIGRALMTDRGRKKDIHFMIEQFRRFTESRATR